MFVVPAVTGVTTPEALMVATAKLELVHAVGVTPVSVMPLELPRQTPEGPVMFAGKAVTVRVRVVLQPLVLV